MPTTKTSDELFHEIKLIGAQAAKLQDRIHACAINCMIHADVHGDARPMQALFDVLPKSQRRMALRTWVEGFSPIFIHTNDGDPGLLVEGRDKKYVPFNIEGAKGTPYWEYTTEEAKLHGAGEYLGKPFTAYISFKKAVKEGTFRGDIEATDKLLASMCALVGDDEKLKRIKAADKKLIAAA